MALSCCSKTVAVDKTVLSDSVEDWTSSKQICGTWGFASFGMGRSVVLDTSSSGQSSMESKAESWGSLVLSGMHWSSVVSESVLQTKIGSWGHFLGLGRTGHCLYRAAISCLLSVPIK
jgi:hypothetical protein